MSPAAPPDSPGNDSPGDDQILDPVFLHSRREAVFILGLWLVCMVWSISACTMLGYNVKPEDVVTYFGIPSWIFWGVAVPWLFADIVTIVFCFNIMVEDDLGEANEGLDLEEEIAEMHAHDKPAGEEGARD